MRTAAHRVIPRERTSEFLADALMDLLAVDPGPAGQQWRECLAQIDAANDDESEASEEPAHQRRSA